MLWWLIGFIIGEIISKSSNWQHIQRLKITVLGANWQLFRLERIAKCSYFILSTQYIKFYWFLMKIKKFLLPIWWYNRDSFPLGNKYFGVFVLNGLKNHEPTYMFIMLTSDEYNTEVNLDFYFVIRFQECLDVQGLELDLDMINMCTKFHVFTT